MKHLTEYSDPARIHALVAEIARISKRPARIMEVCGGQTHAILRHALDTLLPPHVQLLHGPGCPVCVTPSAYLDHAIDIARRSDVVVCTFGDLLRVPLPMMTEERRKELTKVVRHEGEAAKIAIRNLRRDANEGVKKLVKDKLATEDEQKRAEADVQKTTDKFIADVDKVVADKEQEMMTV